MTNKINGIDVSEYFKNHYDNSGKLYAVEYKGNPLELQNAIIRLEQKIEAYELESQEAKEIVAELEYENKELKKENELLNSMVKVNDSTKYDYSKLIEENKRLQELTCPTCGEKLLSPTGAELYEKNVQLQEENEKLYKTLEEIRKNSKNMMQI